MKPEADSMRAEVQALMYDSMGADQIFPLKIRNSKQKEQDHTKKNEKERKERKGIYPVGIQGRKPGGGEQKAKRKRKGVRRRKDHFGGKADVIGTRSIRAEERVCTDRRRNDHRHGPLEGMLVKSPSKERSQYGVQKKHDRQSGHEREQQRDRFVARHRSPRISDQRISYGKKNGRRKPTDRKGSFVHGTPIPLSSI